MIKRILVGYDGSKPADDALLLGGQLATQVDASLVLGASFSDDRLLKTSKSLDEALEAQTTELFREARVRLGEYDAQRVEQRALARDSASEGLQDLAVYEDADLIVIGSTHRGGVGRVLPGSLALQLIGSTPCPLAIAPSGWAAEPREGEAPIVAAFDGSELAGRALSFAASLAAQAGRPLRAIGVAASATQLEAAAMSGAAYPAAYVDRETLQKRLDDALGKLPPDLDTDGKVLDGPPVQALLGAAPGPNGVFVTGSHGRGPLTSLLFGSVSDAIAQRISWPIVLVPPQASLGTNAGAADS